MGPSFEALSKMCEVEKPISIPFSLYSNFVVEEKHGFNKMTVAWLSREAMLPRRSCSFQTC